MSDLSTLIEAARRALSPRPPVAIHAYDVLDSTNTEAKRHASTDTAPALYIARAQREGRGRLGRSFYSPADTGLYMTLAYTTDRPLGELVRTTALAAVAATAAIEALTDKRPRIKWVNDLYLGGGDATGNTAGTAAGKLAGILSEAVTLPAGGTRVVVGFGINLATESFPAGLRAPATSLFAPAEACRVTDIFMGTLAGEIARRLLSFVAMPPRAETLPDGESCLAFYRRHLLYADEPVTCTQGDTVFEAILRGVDEDYSLLAERDGETRVMSSGEISVRRRDTKA